MFDFYLVNRKLSRIYAARGAESSWHCISRSITSWTFSTTLSPGQASGSRYPSKMIGEWCMDYCRFIQGTGLRFNTVKGLTLSTFKMISLQNKSALLLQFYMNDCFFPVQTLIFGSMKMVNIMDLGNHFKLPWGRSFTIAPPNIHGQSAALSILRSWW